ncbi:glutaredoxin family protein [Cytobacillus firmus]|nr:glutaredoxin family protein [Cytobacillus firmus]
MSKITVYTKNGCPKCDMTKNVLKSEGIKFETLNVEKDEKAYDFVVNKLGLREMPVVVVQGQEPFTGFQPDKLQALKK